MHFGSEHCELSVKTLLASSPFVHKEMLGVRPALSSSQPRDGDVASRSELGSHENAFSEGDARTIIRRERFVDEKFKLSIFVQKKSIIFLRIQVLDHAGLW